MPTFDVSRWTIAAWVAVVLFYSVLGLVILAPEAVYSGDIGVKYVQAQALADQHFRTLDIPYPGQSLDPQREFFPLRRPFVIRPNGITQAIFPPASAMLPALAVGPFGFRGFIGLTLAAGAVILAASARLAPRHLGPALIITLGLAGPLWFYAISGWEHAPAVAFSTAAFAVALRGTRHVDRTALIAGLLVGVGAALRDEVVLVAPGLLLALWWRDRSWRSIIGGIAGVTAPLLLAAAVDVWWFERPAAAHLRHAVHVLRTALSISKTPNLELPELEPMTAHDRYFTVVSYWLLGRGTDLQVAAFASGLIAALLIRWRFGSSIGIAIWLAAVGWTTVTDVWDVLTAPKWVAGLLRVAPYVVFAVIPLVPEARRLVASGARSPELPSPRTPEVPSSRTPEVPSSRTPELPRPRAPELTAFRSIVLFTTAIYLVISYLGVDTNGGKSLGPRLLLPLLPLLTVSAVVAIASYLKSPVITDRLVGWMGVAYVVMGLAIHLGGAVPAYRQRNLDDSSAILALARSPERIVVADDMYTAQLLFPLYDRKIILLADSPDRGQVLGQLLVDQRDAELARAVLVSRNPEPAVMLPPLSVERTEQQGRMRIQYWRR